jgi:hypothetical protein
VAVHIYAQTIHKTTQITTEQHITTSTQIITNVEDYRPCPVFASFTLAFALQLRKKHGKTSVRLRKTSVKVHYLPKLRHELAKKLKP